MLIFLKQKIWQIRKIEKEKITSIAGIIILISIFLPVNYLLFVSELGSYQDHRWIYGQHYEIFTNTDGIQSYHMRFFIFNFPGFIITILVVVVAIKIILKAHSIKGRKIMRLGISTIIILVLDSGIQLFAASFLRPNLVLFLPHIGFVGIFLGGLLAIISGSNYEKY